MSGRLSQFVPELLGSGFKSGGSPEAGPYSWVRAAGTAHFYLLCGAVTADESHVWLRVPPESAIGANFLGPRSPASLRIWTKGAGSTAAAFVLPTYRLGIYRPATYAPNVAPNGGAGTYTCIDTAPVMSWLTPTTTDAHAADGSDWTDTVETVMAITPLVGLSSPLARGQLVIYATGATSAGKAYTSLLGCGWRM